MRLIGLTGGIGMGKSTVSDYLVRTGENVMDTDVLARRLVEPGQKALEDIRKAFGGAVINARGELDRPAMARAVFSNERLRKQLEAILHPRIRAAWITQAKEWRQTGLARAIIVVPLLYETGAEGEFDQIICVGTSDCTQRQRLALRGWTELEIRQRNNAQWPIARKMEMAHGVIWNESPLEICEEQCERLIERG
jgi:dephospho-CoA kinase